MFFLHLKTSLFHTFKFEYIYFTYFLIQFFAYIWTILIFQQIIHFPRTKIWHWVVFPNWKPTRMGYLLPLDHDLKWFMCKDSQCISEIKQISFFDTLECFLSLNGNYAIYFIFLFSLVQNAAAPPRLDFSALPIFLFPMVYYFLFFY